MKNIVKQAISFILPITVLIVVPWCIEDHISIKHATSAWIGILLMGLGLYVMIITISTFIRIGNGTLAPWSSTKKLITSGIYGYVRNPMIMGVLTVLIGESITIASVNIVVWAMIFFIINNLYFKFYEEPDLEKKFGDDYRTYKKNVHRWIPGTKSFQPNAN